MSSEPTHPDAERDPEPSEVPVDPVIDDPTAPRDEDLLVARMLEHTIDLPELASAVEAQESAAATRSRAMAWWRSLAWRACASSRCST